MKRFETVWRRCAAAGLGLALAGTALLSAPAAALAVDQTTITDSNSGTTKVTVEASDEYLSFKVPTVIPFVALASGELVGPTASATCITNLSVFGIHVVEATVSFDSVWAATTDAASSESTNAIDFQFGVSGSTLMDACSTDDDDVSDDAAYNMTYAGGSSDSLAIETAGTVANVTENLKAGSAVEVAAITWTLSAGNA